MTAVDRTRWWWIRHAPVDWAGSRIYGATDLDADVSDAAPLAALAKRLPHGAVVVTSHLKRTEQTRAALAAQGAALAGPSAVERDLGEQHLGDWEGRTWSELEEAGDSIYHEFWRDPAHTVPPRGESFAAMTRRVAAVVERLSETHKGRDIVCVAHAGTIRAALCLAMDILEAPDRAFAFHIRNTSLTRIDCAHPGWVIESVGERHD